MELLLKQKHPQKKKDKKQLYHEFIASTKRYKQQKNNLTSIKQFNKKFDGESDEALKEIKDILTGRERIRDLVLSKSVSGAF